MHLVQEQVPKRGGEMAQEKGKDLMEIVVTRMISWDILGMKYVTFNSKVKYLCFHVLDRPVTYDGICISNI